MSTVEQNQCLDPWSTIAPPDEDDRTPCDESYFSEDDNDNVAWPPVIARISDLDKLVAPESPPLSPAPSPTPSPAPETQKPLNSIGVKKSDGRRRNQNISSRLIALAGIVIFLAAIVPFMHLRDNKINNETADTALQPTPPAANPAPAMPGGIASTAEPGKAQSQPPAAPPVTPPATPPAVPPAAPPAPALLANDVKPAAAPPASAPPLVAPTEKRELPESMPANPSPAKAANPPAGTTAEQIATQPTTAGAGTPAQTNTPGIPSPPPQSNAEANKVVEIGESEPWPIANPTKVDPANVENKMLRGAELSHVLPPPPSTGLGASPTLPNQPMVSGAIPPPVMTNSPQAYPNGQLPYTPRPAAIGPGNDNRGPYREADVRSGYRQPYNPVPDYRLTPAPDYRTNIPTNGQVQPLNGQVPPAYRQVSPPVGRGGAMPTQTPQQYNPYQTAPPTYPANQSNPSSTLPGSAAGGRQNGGGNQLPPAYNNNPYNNNPYNNNPYSNNPYSNLPYNNNPSAVPPGTANPGVGAPDGYHIPPATGDPTYRY